MSSNPFKSKDRYYGGPPAPTKKGFTVEEYRKSEYEIMKRAKERVSTDYHAHIADKIKTGGIDEGYVSEPSGPTKITDSDGQKIIIPQIPAPQVKFPGFQDHYMEFDTNNLDGTSTISRGELIFDISKILDVSKLNNVIEMYIYPFYIPNIITPATKPVYFFYKRLNILVEEFKGSSFVSTNGRKFHFPMLVQSRGIANLLTPDNDDGKFTFSNASVEANKLTFVFRAPEKPVNFAKTSYSFTTVAGSNPGRLTLTEGHGETLASEVAVYITGFASNDSTINTLMNDPDGIMVTASATDEFTLPNTFDFTGFGAVTGTVFIAVRRFSFRVRFRVKSEAANGILAVSD